MDFQTIKSLAFTFSPFLISYGISYYRTLKAQSQSSLPIRRPVPSHVKYALYLLLVGAIISAWFCLPFLSPENILTATSSRLQTPSDVLWKRVAQSRPDAVLTPFDEQLKERLTTINSRLFYLKYGPHTLVDCHFCDPEDPMSYLIYALPSILFPHLANIAVLALATAKPLSGGEGSRWRMHVVLAGFIISFADVYAFHAYDQSRNARVLRSQDLVHFYWTMRLVRYLCISALDLGIAALLWATSTNRILVSPLPATEKLQQLSRQLHLVTGKIGGTIMLKNAIVRNDEPRAASEGHWRDEAQATREVMADESVRRSINQALSSSRLNIEKIEREARTYSEGLVQSLRDEIPG